MRRVEEPTVCYGTSLLTPSLKRMYKVWTGTPPPSHTYCGEDEYASDCAEDSADDASASTGKEANGASDEAA